MYLINKGFIFNSKFDNNYVFLKGGDFFLVSKNVFLMFDSECSNSYSNQAGVSLSVVNYNFIKF